MTAIPAHLLEGLDPYQTAAVTHLDGPVQVIAGPGSGKTSVLTRRTAALSHTGIPAHRILAVTFTSKAAAEMRDRITTLTDPGTAQSMSILTFHALGARILRRYHDHVGLSEHFTIADPAASRRMLFVAARTAGLATHPDLPTLLDTAAGIISTQKNAGILTPARYTPRADQRHLPALWNAYQTLCRDRDTVDFDDLLTIPVSLLSDPGVAAALASRFDRVLVDEFQDTNTVQQTLLEALAPTGQICVVGDPDQSIYAFRGATGAIGHMFTTRYPDHEVIVLHNNYRSTATICTTVSAVIAPNPSPHRSHITPTLPQGSPVRLHVAADTDDEATWVARQIAGTPTDRTVAILVRTNTQTLPLERALAAAGLRHSLQGTRRFTDRPEIRDAIAWLTLLANPNDTAALTAALTVPRRTLPAGAVSTITTLARRTHTDLFQAARAAAQSDAQLRGIAAALSAAETANQSGSAEQVVRCICDDLGLREHHLRSGSDSAAERAGNLDELLAVARTLDTASHSNPAAALLHHLHTPKSNRRGPDVVISTIHAAKGKEYDDVYVVGCEETIIPHHRALADGPQEERRLFFVACSRARRQLTVTRSAVRFSHDRGMTSNPPSRFLSDIPSDVLTISKSPHAPDTPAAPPRTTTSRHGVRWKVGDTAAHRVFGPAVITAISAGMVTATFDRDGSSRTFAPDGKHLYRRR